MVEKSQLTGPSAAAAPEQLAPKTLDEIAAVCSSCGTCMSACPVYQAVLDEPAAPRGKVNLLKAIADGRLPPSRANRQRLYQCLVCGGCADVCPAKIDYMRLMIGQRRAFAAGSHIPLLKKAALLLYRPFFMKLLARLLAALNRTPLQRVLSLPKPRLQSLKPYLQPITNQEYDVLLFPGCALSYFYPAFVVQIKELLERQGLRVAIPKGLQCCGFPFMSQGWGRRADALRDHNVRVLSRYRFAKIVVPCPTGAMMLREFYGQDSWRVYELSDFMFQFLPAARVQPVRLARAQRVTIHDSCHAAKSLKIKTPPRHFLRQLGARFVDDASGLCCGFGGFFKIGFPRLSKIIASRKAQRVRDLGADAVVTACPGCYMQLQQHLAADVVFFSELFAADEYQS